MYSKRDGRSMGVTVELPAGTTLEKSQRAADLIGEILRDKPYLEAVIKLVGQKSAIVQGSLGEALAPQRRRLLDRVTLGLFQQADLQQKAAKNFSGHSRLWREREPGGGRDRWGGVQR